MTGYVTVTVPPSGGGNWRPRNASITHARSAASLVHSPRLPEVLALARRRFDTVIIDTPPMINMADARVIAKLADGLILVVRSGSTTRDAALLAKARFAADGIPVMGTILNFWNPRTPGYGYYKHYYAGYYNYYGNGSGPEAGNGNADAHAPEDSGSTSRSLRRRTPLRSDSSAAPRLSDGPAPKI